MQFRTKSGEKVSFGSGFVIALYRAENFEYIILETSMDYPQRVNWPGCSDDKKFAPLCIKTVEDFQQIVNLIADTHGLYARRIPDRPYGPAFVFEEKR